jgi:uncharacterized membrane protein
VRYSREESEFDRAIGFFDATFALALTLLVVTLEVDDKASAWQSLGTLFDALGTQFIAFAIAFAVIAKFWLINHRMIASFVALDTTVIVTNLFLIAAIVVLPFSTEAVGDPATEGLALPTATMAVNVAVASGLSTLVYWLAWKRDLLDRRPSPEALHEWLVASTAPAVIFLVSIPIAVFVSPEAAQLSWLLLIVSGWLTNPRTHPKRKAAK